MKQEITIQSKEILNITPTPWEVGFGDGQNSYSVYNSENKYATREITEEEDEANAKAILTAVNFTYGKGYNPAAMEQLYHALKDLAYVVGYEYRGTPALLKALAALESAKPTI